MLHVAPSGKILAEAEGSNYVEPHFGGHIELLIGTMIGAVHLLPGTTQSSVAAKDGYKAEVKAAMTLSEFDSWFALEICRYNNSIHSSLGLLVSTRN